MKYLFVLYDSRCGVCTRIKSWLQGQRAYLPLHLVAMQSDEAKRRFPATLLSGNELAVISDSGEVWLGDRAWITCLWALHDFRAWAERLSRPALLPFARQAFLELSHHRFALSRLLNLRSEEDVRRYLIGAHAPACEVNSQ